MKVIDACRTRPSKKGESETNPNANLLGISHRCDGYVEFTKQPPTRSHLGVECGQEIGWLAFQLLGPRHIVAA